MVFEDVLNYLDPLDEPFGFLRRTRWDHADTAYAAGDVRIIIIGRPGAGKKTLCTSLWGWSAVEQPQPVRHLGLITLIDLPTDLNAADGLLYPLETASLILHMVDAAHPLDPVDLTWAARMRALNVPMVVVANCKANADAAAHRELHRLMGEKYARPVLTVNAADSLSVHQRFLPKLLKACPDLSDQLGAEFAGMRRQIAGRMIMQTAMTGAVLNVTGDTAETAAALASMQMNLIKRIAALYGRPERSARRLELLLSTSARMLLKRLHATAAVNPRLQTMLLMGSAAAVSTMVVGWLAVLYYSNLVFRWWSWMAREREKRSHAADSAASA